ncbi:riboflavin kinase fad synthetase family protein, putative [Ichthyophthirius multifiliis]|uniref:riboflavin kinase n=1 Tax=Ichthyophthirius multifiliis TaxID=5932 RepID=G0R487_ICHMU|nr:riboflavin kinase fad synthetase family protein, putative [Ichthyophthirius multifiliis]EGR27698.1 riboflavin kinase fad synthetase family protein, putative [Ichthyophthirius multifiliis]|eukprot:XP_004025150.1 riboflavin kinase fad synthetase family protein, putative [Ichthyophthirius multifiliis]
MRNCGHLQIYQIINQILHDYCYAHLSLFYFYFNFTTLSVISSGINIPNQSRILFEQKLPIETFSAIPAEYINQKCKEQEFIDLLEKHFDIIKPIIGAPDTIQFLQQNQYQIVLFTNLDEKLIQNISYIHKDWLYNTQIIHFQNLQEIFEKAFIIIEGDNQVMEMLSQLNQENNKDKILIYLKNSDFHNKTKFKEIQGVQYYTKWEDINWKKSLNNDSIQLNVQFPQEENKLSLHKEPINMSFKGFNKDIKLDQEIIIESQVVRGNGRANQDLGIPTANLLVKREISVKLNNLLTGVYSGKAIVEGMLYIQ